MALWVSYSEIRCQGYTMDGNGDDHGDDAKKVGKGNPKKLTVQQERNRYAF